MIEIVTGLPGSGKTLYMTKRILDARRSGRRVLANFHSRKNFWEFGLWEDFKNADNALCVIDEAQMWLNSRGFKNNGIEDLAVFQQSRKNGLDLVCVVQHENRLDVAVRELAAYLNRCKNLWGKWTLVKRYPMEEISGGVLKPKPLERVLFRHNPDLYNHYFTTEVIGGRDGAGYQLGAASSGGRTELTGGRLKPTHYRFESEFGVQYIPVAQFDVHWDWLASLHPRSKGSFFTYRPFAWIEGQIIWTDDEREISTYTIVDQLLDTGWVRLAERLERKVGLIK